MSVTTEEALLLEMASVEMLVLEPRELVFTEVKFHQVWWFVIVSVSAR